MKRVIGGALSALLLGVFHGTPAQAATINAVSCNAADVQTAVNRAASGDTVTVPGGTCGWITQVTWTAPANVTLLGAGSQSTVGGGDATVIVDNSTTSNSAAADPDKRFRKFSNDRSDVSRRNGVSQRFRGNREYHRALQGYACRSRPYQHAHLQPGE